VSSDTRRPSAANVKSDQDWVGPAKFEPATPLTSRHRQRVDGRP